MPLEIRSDDPVLNKLKFTPYRNAMVRRVVPFVPGGIRAVTSLRLTPEEEYEGADLLIHKISATAERETLW